MTADNLPPVVHVAVCPMHGVQGITPRDRCTELGCFREVEQVAFVPAARIEAVRDHCEYLAGDRLDDRPDNLLVQAAAEAGREVLALLDGEAIDGK